MNSRDPLPADLFGEIAQIRKQPRSKSEFIFKFSSTFSLLSASYTNDGGKTSSEGGSNG
jgi:hypothetical protein